MSPLEPSYQKPEAPQGLGCKSPGLVMTPVLPFVGGLDGDAPSFFAGGGQFIVCVKGSSVQFGGIGQFILCVNGLSVQFGGISSATALLIGLTSAKTHRDTSKVELDMASSIPAS